MGLVSSAMVVVFVLSELEGLYVWMLAPGKMEDMVDVVVEAKSDDIHVDSEA